MAKEYEITMAFPEYAAYGEQGRAYRVEQAKRYAPLDDEHDAPLPTWAVNLLCMSALGHKAKIRAALLHHSTITGKPIRSRLLGTAAKEAMQTVRREEKVREAHRIALLKAKRKILKEEEAIEKATLEADAFIRTESEREEIRQLMSKTEFTPDNELPTIDETASIHLDDTDEVIGEVNEETI
jgi:hypothetical protein